MSEIRPQSVADLDLLDLEEEVFIDTEATTYGFGPPPPDGRYVAKVEFQTEKSPTGFVSGVTRNGNKYLMAYLSLTIQQLENRAVHGRKLFDQPSTMVLESVSTCGIASLLKEGFGVAVPARVSPKHLAIMLRDCIGPGAMVGIETQWQARAETNETDPNTGKRKWKTFRRGMKKFPEKYGPNGEVVGYNHCVEYPATGEMVEAQAQVVGYFLVE